MRSLHASLANARLTYWSLSLGVFCVFAVGLNRPDFSDQSQVALSTGGYDAYIQMRVPMQYDLNDSSARSRLRLEGLSKETSFLQFTRHTQDDASCLNLNKISTPTILGIDLSEMTPFGLNPVGSEGVYVDEESLLWSMMKQVGDTIVYADAQGDSVRIPIVGTYPTGIFHGNAIMDASLFRRLWPEECGTQVLLLKSHQPDADIDLLSVALGEYGLNIQTCHERLQMFFQVTRTYLLIFLTLGSIGLFLGIFCLFINVRKSLLAHRQELIQLHSLGFSNKVLHTIFFKQNVITPLFSVLAGSTGALVSISANAAGAGLMTILSSIVLLLAMIYMVVYGVRREVDKEINELK